MPSAPQEGSSSIAMRTMLDVLDALIPRLSTEDLVLLFHTSAELGREVARRKAFSQPGLHYGVNIWGRQGRRRPRAPREV